MFILFVCMLRIISCVPCFEFYSKIGFIVIVHRKREKCSVFSTQITVQAQIKM